MDSLYRLFSALLVLTTISFAVAADGNPRYRMQAVNEIFDVAGSTITKNGSQPRLPLKSAERIGSQNAAGSPGTALGRTTDFEIQQNASMGRQIAELEGLIHAVFTTRTAGFPSERSVYLQQFAVMGSGAANILDNGSVVNRIPLADTSQFFPGGALIAFSYSGFANVRYLPDGRAAFSSHRYDYLTFPAANVSFQIGVQAEPSFPFFAANEAPQPPGDTSFFPRFAVDIVGADTIVHVISTETVSSFDTPLSTYYSRGVLSANTIVFDAPVFIDSTSRVSAVIEASPVSDDVAIVYARHRGDTSVDMNNDGYYTVSTDGGLNWGTPQNFSELTSGSSDQVYGDMDAVYDDDNVLHAVYNTLRYVSDSGSVLAPCDLWHWNNVRSLPRRVACALWSNACSAEFPDRGSAQDLLLAKPVLSIKAAGDGPGVGIADELLYTVWVQYGPTDSDCATQDGGGTPGGSVNSEIYSSVSSDDGLTWDRPRNLTGTVTPDCLPGNCHSEGWVTAAARADSGLYLSYLDDAHAGSSLHLQGVPTQSPYMVYAVETWVPGSEPRICIEPTDFIDLTITIPDMASVTVVLDNLGTSTLNYAVEVTDTESGLAHVTVNDGSSYAGTRVAGSASDILIVDIDGDGLPDASQWNWRLKVTSNDSDNDTTAGGDPIFVNFHVNIVDTAIIVGCPITMTGDVNLSATLTSADIIYLVNFVFKGGAVPMPCEATGDVNCNGTVTSADIIYMVNHVFKSGPVPCDVCAVIPGLWSCA